MKKFLSLLGFLTITFAGFSQSPRYVIQFTDKKTTTYNLQTPSAFLSQRAIDRRTRYQIPIDSFDLPVPKNYIEQVAAIPGVTILNVSRWLNAVAIQITDQDALLQIKSLPFVKADRNVAAKAYRGPENLIREDLAGKNSINSSQFSLQDFYDYGNNAYKEIDLHKGQFLHNIGLRGEQMQIAMLDGGYFQYTTLRSFDSMNINNRVLSTWDFVDHETSVAEDHPHGMFCLSTMAANLPGEFVGKAPQASYHLYRTEETATEFPIEEFNWACGAERADSIGADVITASLGYGYGFSGTFEDYPYTIFNGDITISAQAADRAAQKGLLIFCAAGNAGTSSWKRIMTPADADSVVAVGAVSSSGVVGAFSSYGPTADGRIKPDVSSVGVAAVVQNTNNNLATSNGTSLATPNMAGLATCLWQGFPEFSNMDIVQVLKESAHLFNRPDSQMGYGIPDMKKAFSTLLTRFSTATVSENFCKARIEWESKDVAGMKYEIERKKSGENGFAKIAELEAKGNKSLSIQSYSFEHDLSGTEKGEVQFRIKQIIDTAVGDINEVYIDTVKLQLNATCASQVVAVRLAPNVTSDQTLLLIETATLSNTMAAVLYDAKGTRVWSKSISKQSGIYQETINVNHLAKGVYILKVWDQNKEVGTTHLIKL